MALYALSEHQKIAVRHYVVHGDKLAAYELGLADNDPMTRPCRVRNANVMFNKQRVQAEVMRHQQRQEDLIDMSVQDLKQGFARIAARCMMDRLDRDGTRIPINPGAAVRALEAYAKVSGYPEALPGFDGGRGPTTLDGDDGDDGDDAVPLSTDDWKVLRLQMLTQDDC